MDQTSEEELQVQQVLYEYVHQGRVPVILQTQQVVAALSQVLPYIIMKPKLCVEKSILRK